MLKKIMMLCLVLFSQQFLPSDSRKNLPSSNNNEQEMPVYNENSARAVFMRSCGDDRSDKLDANEAWSQSSANDYDHTPWGTFTFSSDSTALSGLGPAWFGPTWSDPTSLSCYDFSLQASTSKRLSCELTEPELSLLRQAMEKKR